MAVSSKRLIEGERVVLSVRTHAKALVWPGLILVVTCAVSGFLLGVRPGGSTGRWLGWAILAVALAVVLTGAVAPFLRWLSSTSTLTNRRLIQQRGVFTRSGRVIPLLRVNDVSFEKGLLDRLLGCGTLVVSDASEQAGLRLPDVPHVEEVHRRLSDLVLRAQHDRPDADP
ncbi:MAG: PH domain-containing protein [Nocardioidaceae bacterium]